MSALKEQIQQDMKDTMRAKDQRRLTVIRLLLAAIKQREVDERIVLEDTQIIGVIEKMLKQRRESIASFQKGGRQDLVDQESYEITILEKYLPEQLSNDEIDHLIEQALQETGASSIKDMGKVMSSLKLKIQGNADITQVSQKVKNALASSST